MRATKTVFLALLAVFALSAVAASSALASPEWYVKKAKVFKKVTGNVNVNFENSFELIDTVERPIIGERLAVSCKSAGEEGDPGEIKSAGAGLIGSFAVSTCKGIEGSPPLCERLRRAEGLNLGWIMELYKEGSEVRDRVLPSVRGNPNWEFICENRSFNEEYYETCEFNTSTKMSNNAAAGIVEAKFDAKSNKTTCSFGGAESGEWKGTLKIKPSESEKKKGVEAIKVE